MGLLKVKCKSVQHVKETVKQFGHVNVSTLGPVQAAKALRCLGKVEWRLGVYVDAGRHLLERSKACYYPQHRRIWPRRPGP